MHAQELTSRSRDAITAKLWKLTEGFKRLLSRPRKFVALCFSSASGPACANANSLLNRVHFILTPVDILVSQNAKHACRKPDHHAAAACYLISCCFALHLSVMLFSSEPTCQQFTSCLQAVHKLSTGTDVMQEGLVQYALDLQADAIIWMGRFKTDTPEGIAQRYIPASACCQWACT